MSFFPMLKSFFPRLRKIVGFPILIFSFLVGTLSIGISDFTLSQRIFMYVLFGIVPAYLGAILVMGKEEFKQIFWKFVRLYTFITILFPAFLHLNDYIAKWKINTVSTPEDIYLDLFSSQWIGYVEIFVVFLTFILFAPIYVNGWNWLPKQTRHLFLVLLLLSPIIVFFTKNDFRAIREQGIVISKFDNQENYSWDEIEKVELYAFIGRDLRYSEFKWKYVFYLVGGGTRVFDEFSYYPESVHKSIEIKKKILQENIPLYLDQLTDKEWDFVKIDMEEYPEIEDEFYAIFQYDPITDSYYYD